MISIMETKKKNVRSAKERMIEMEEVIHRQCVELDAWREKYRALRRRGFWARLLNK